MPDGSTPDVEIRASSNEEESDPISDNRQDVIANIKAELGEICLKKLIGYWTYAVCPFKFVEQYYLEKGRKQMQFDLGFFVEDEEPEGAHSALPAYAQFYTKGTQKRKAKITFKCGETTELKSMTEAEELSYEFVITTPHVCTKKVDPSKQTPYQLILPYQNQCIFLNAGWWTYKHCHLLNVTQFHRENRAAADADTMKQQAANWVTVADFGLGEFPKSVKPAEISTYGNVHVATRPEETYISYTYIGGTPCDIGSLQKRETEVRWYCDMEEVNAISSIKEISSCKYVMKVVARSLCSHPAFTPVKAMVHEIDCRPLEADKVWEDDKTEEEAGCAAESEDGDGSCTAPPESETETALETEMETEN